MTALCETGEKSRLESLLDFRCKCLEEGVCVKLAVSGKRGGGVEPAQQRLAFGVYRVIDVHGLALDLFEG